MRDGNWTAAIAMYFIESHPKSLDRPAVANSSGTASNSTVPDEATGTRLWYVILLGLVDAKPADGPSCKKVL